MHAHWDLAVLVGLPILIVMVLVLLGFLIWSICRLVPVQRQSRIDKAAGKMSYERADPSGWWIITCVVGLFTLVAIVLPAVLYFPYGAQYHRFVPKAGVVKQITTRFVGGDQSTDQVFGITYANGNVYSCGDTRCSAVHVGDTLHLSCKRDWQYSASPGWTCNYVKDVKP